MQRLRYTLRTTVAEVRVAVPRFLTVRGLTSGAVRDGAGWGAFQLRRVGKPIWPEPHHRGWRKRGVQESRRHNRGPSGLRIGGGSRHAGVCARRSGPGTALGIQSESIAPHFRLDCRLLCRDRAQPSHPLPDAPRYQVPLLCALGCSGQLWRVAGDGPADKRPPAEAVGHETRGG